MAQVPVIVAGPDWDSDDSTVVAGSLSDDHSDAGSRWGSDTTLAGDDDEDDYKYGGKDDGKDDDEGEGGDDGDDDDGGDGNDPDDGDGDDDSDPDDDDGDEDDDDEDEATEAARRGWIALDYVTRKNLWFQSPFDRLYHHHGRLCFKKPGCRAILLKWDEEAAASPGSFARGRVPVYKAISCERIPERARGSIPITCDGVPAWSQQGG